MDTPGVLWPKLDNQTSAYLLAITGAIKDEILPIESVVEFALDYLVSNPINFNNVMELRPILILIIY